MPKFVWYKTTDYEFALNKVADQYGGGTEIWRPWLPGMTYKHFYPRQPKSDGEGPAEASWRSATCRARGSSSARCPGAKFRT